MVERWALEAEPACIASAGSGEGETRSMMGMWRSGG